LPHGSARKFQEAAFIKISRDELFMLDDIADALKLLRDIAENAPEMQLIQVELVIQKASRCAWTLIHEELDGRGTEDVFNR
jgi:hypothetical protein